MKALQSAYLGVPEVSTKIITLRTELEGDNLVHSDAGDGFQLSERPTAAQLNRNMAKTSIVRVVVVASELVSLGRSSHVLRACPTCERTLDFEGTMTLSSSTTA